MDIYIGCKIIQAERQDRDDEEGYKVIYSDGYVSWSPKNVFEEFYRLVSNPELASLSAYV